MYNIRVTCDFLQSLYRPRDSHANSDITICNALQIKRHPSVFLLTFFFVFLFDEYFTCNGTIKMKRVTDCKHCYKNKYDPRFLNKTGNLKCNF